MCVSLVKDAVGYTAADADDTHVVTSIVHFCILNMLPRCIGTGKPFVSLDVVLHPAELTDPCPFLSLKASMMCERESSAQAATFQCLLCARESEPFGLAPAGF